MTDTTRLPDAHHARRLFLHAAIALLLGGVMVVAAYGILRRQAPAPLPPLTLALPTQLNSASLIVASDQGLFREAGVDVVNQPFLLGKDALKSVLDGEADLAVVADTPFIFALLAGKDISELASVSQARRALAIVARKDRNIRSVQDLDGKSVALTLGTNFPYFLDAMLNVHGVARERVVRQDLKTDAVLDAFRAGRVDAAVVFQPYLARLQAEMGERFNTFYGEDVYAFRFLLVGKPAYIKAHPQEIRRVLRALIAANASIRAEPARARRAIGTAVQVDDATMVALFDPEDYVLTLDESMLLAMDDQTRWAMKRGLVPAGPVPNYLGAIRFEDLEAVEPRAVRYAH